MGTAELMSIAALIAERDALKAENERLRAALTLADRIAEQGQNHSANFALNQLGLVRDCIRAALERRP